MRAQLVVNPQSRRGGQIADAVRAAMRGTGVELVDNATANGIEAIVVVGGDGTLAGQIPRALDLDVPIGLVPGGTFNDLARTLAIPTDVNAACDVIAAGRTRAVDVAHVNGAYYVTEASIGISSRISRLQRSADKQRFGLFAVIATALQAFWHARPIHAEIAYDGKTERFKTIQLTVANSERFGGLVTVEGSSIDDGWLDLYAVEIESIFEFFSVVAAIVAHKRREVWGLRTYRARAFEVTTRHAHRISADGEPAGVTPARFALAPKKLKIFAP